MIDTSKSNEQVAGETATAIRDSRDQPEKYKEILATAENQGVPREWMATIAKEITADKSHESVDKATANFGIVIAAVKQENPALAKEMEENTYTAARRLGIAIEAANNKDKGTTYQFPPDNGRGERGGD